MVIPRIKAAVLLVMLSLVLSTCGSNGQQSTASITIVPAPVCAEAYTQAVDACVAASGCGGIGCIFTYEYCASRDGWNALSACCRANYTGNDVTTCAQTYGWMQ